MKTNEMSNFLLYNKVSKCYQNECHKAISEYGLTRNEIDVLMFLKNNAPLDSAKDIVNYRGVSKSLVCKSVDSLSKKGYLRIRRDEKDKRYLHLQLSDKADPLIKILEIVNHNFNDTLLIGFNQKERDTLNKLHMKIQMNIEKL